MEEKFKDISHLMERFVTALSESANDISSLDAHEAGEVADIIKDLAEAKKECAEAEYYISVKTAMDENPMEGMDMVERFGYNPTRMANGRYGYISPKVPQSMPSMSQGWYNPNESYRMGYYDPEMRLKETVDTLKKMWASADEDTKMHLRKEVKALAEEMNV